MDLSAWHENVLLTCPVPREHCFGEGEIRSEFNDPTIPSTWNGCCSPECGNWIDGYLVSAPEDDPVRLHWQSNREAGEAAVAARRRVVDACEHPEWVENGRSYFQSYKPDGEGGFESIRFQSLLCPACRAVKPGERLDAAASR